VAGHHSELYKTLPQSLSAESKSREELQDMIHEELIPLTEVNRLEAENISLQAQKTDLILRRDEIYAYVLVYILCDTLQFPTYVLNF